MNWIIRRALEQSTWTGAAILGAALTMAAGPAPEWAMEIMIGIAGAVKMLLPERDK